MFVGGHQVPSLSSTTETQKRSKIPVLQHVNNMTQWQTCYGADPDVILKEVKLELHGQNAPKQYPFIRCAFAQSNIHPIHSVFSHALLWHQLLFPPPLHHGSSSTGNSHDDAGNASHHGSGGVGARAGSSSSGSAGARARRLRGAGISGRGLVVVAGAGGGRLLGAGRLLGLGRLGLGGRGLGVEEGGGAAVRVDLLLDRGGADVVGAVVVAAGGDDE